MKRCLSGAKSRWERAGARRESSVLTLDGVRPNDMLGKTCRILGKICLYRKMLLLLCDWRVKILPPKCSTGTCLALWLAMDRGAAKWNLELRKCWMLFNPRSKMFQVSSTQVFEHENSHASATQLLFLHNYWGSDFEKAQLQFLSFFKFLNQWKEMGTSRMPILRIYFRIKGIMTQKEQINPIVLHYYLRMFYLHLIYSCYC